MRKIDSKENKLFVKQSISTVQSGWIVPLLSTVILIASAGLLSGCSNTAMAAASEPPTIVQETKSDTAKDKTETKAAAENVKLQLGEEIFNQLEYGVSFDSNAYFRFLDAESGLYGAVNQKGVIVIPAEYAVLEVGEDALFGYKQIEDAALKNPVYQNMVFDNDLGLLMEWETDEYLIRSCNDGVAAFSSEKEPEKYVYKDVYAAADKVIDPAKDFPKYECGSAFQNKYALILAAEKKSDKPQCYFMDRSGNYRQFEYMPLYAEKTETLMAMKAEGKMLPFTQDGWVLYDETALKLKAPNQKEGSIRPGYGLYNLYARQNIWFPEGLNESYSWNPVKKAAAGTALYMKNGYADWVDAADASHRFYDVYRKNFPSELSYAYIEMSDLGNESGYVLCKNMDGKWGWVNDSFVPTTFYDYASSFCGGYAVVIQDGEAFVVDEKLNAVSERIPAESCVLLNPDSSHVHFALYDAGAKGCRILSVESEKLEKKHTEKSCKEWNIYAGRYMLKSMTADGKVVEVPEAKQAGSSVISHAAELELFKDGTGDLISTVQILPIHWDNKKFYLDKENVEYTYADGVIGLEFDSTEGKLYMEFVK